MSIYRSVVYLVETFGFLFVPFFSNSKNERKNLLVFYFHAIYASNEEKDLKHVDPQTNLTTNQFIEFIEYFLHHKYRFIGPDDLLNDLPEDQPCIMISFDDGYFNNMLAIDILNKYKIPAIFFITARNVLDNKSFWWDIVYRNRIKQGASSGAIRKEQLYLKDFKYDFIDNYLDQNFGKKCMEPWSDIDRPMNVAEINTISKNPLVILGNHTYSHSILPNYSVEEIKEEIRLCNKTLFEITGITPNSIAFPNGNYDQKIILATEEIGLLYAFTTEGKPNILPISKNTPIVLNRFMALPISVRKYAALSRLGYTPHSLFEKLKKEYIQNFSKKIRVPLLIFLNNIIISVFS